MCIGGGSPGGMGPKDIQERQEAIEAERQANIRQGAANIDEMFARFNPGFYQDFQNSYLGFYEPQLDQQFNKARGSAVTSLMDRGILGSTEGIRALTDVQDRAALERTNLGNRALDASKDLEGRISNEKTNLYALNESAADPTRASALASGAASSLVAPRSFEMLGNVFGDVIGNLPAVLASRQQSIAPVTRTYAGSTGSTRAPSGSGRIIG